MGTDDVIYDTEDDEHPGKASVTVYRFRHGVKVGYTATARWEEYVQMYKPQGSNEWQVGPMWKKMPYLMLGKVAETLALRKAFPDEMSGVYTFEEMEQATNPEGAVPQRTPKRPPVEEPRRASEAPPAKPQGEVFESTIVDSKPAQSGGALWIKLEDGTELPAYGYRVKDKSAGGHSFSGHVETEVVTGK